MELDNMAQFLQGKTILVTGATGFLAKVFVEEILRVQPDVSKLYLLIRASDDKSAKKRLYDEMISTELFRVVREIWGSKLDAFISSKVIAVVAGDIRSKDLELKDSILREKMKKEIEIIVNVAASTNFNERYDVALDINTFGAFNILSFGKQCDKIKLLLHVSTAYVCGEQTRMILEKQFHMNETLKKTANLNIIDEKRIAKEKIDKLRLQRIQPNGAIKIAMKKFGLKRAKSYGWPNTYVFTKAMGEMLLGKFKGDLPLVIIRPTMITSTYKQPFPGWIEGVRTIDSLIASYGKGTLKYFIGNPKSVIDLIPVDMVVNAMVVSMEIHYANHHDSGDAIYHVGSSLKNPIKVFDIQKFANCYFTKNPWIDRNGQRVEAGKLTMFSNADKFFLYVQLKYVFPLKVFSLVNILSCQRFEKNHTELDRKIKSGIRLAQLYKPYMFFNGIFDDANLEKMQRVAKERGIDVAEYNFDSMNIDWEEYIMNIHIPGLIEHAIKS